MESLSNCRTLEISMGCTTHPCVVITFCWVFVGFFGVIGLVFFSLYLLLLLLGVFFFSHRVILCKF